MYKVKGDTIAKNTRIGKVRSLPSRGYGLVRYNGRDFRFAVKDTPEEILKRRDQTTKTLGVKVEFEKLPAKKTIFGQEHKLATVRLLRLVP